MSPSKSENDMNNDQPVLKKVSSFRERIGEILDLYEISASEFARRTNLNKSVVSLYLNGKREPMQSNIIAIAESLNINSNWLMGFDAPMKLITKDKQYLENEDFHIAIDCNEKVRNFVDEYMQLSDEKKELVEKLVHFLSENE